MLRPTPAQREMQYEAASAPRLGPGGRRIRPTSLSRDARLLLVVVSGVRTGAKEHNQWCRVYCTSRRYSVQRTSKDYSRVAYHTSKIHSNSSASPGRYVTLSNSPAHNSSHTVRTNTHRNHLNHMFVVSCCRRCGHGSSCINWLYMIDFLFEIKLHVIHTGARAARAHPSGFVAVFGGN